MKKSIVVLVAGLALSASAFADDGVINISGALTGSTCSVNGNAAGTSTTISVTLPTLPAAGLSAAGDTSGATAFSIHLSDCTSTSATTYFEAGPTVNLATGNLFNQVAVGGAEQVEVGILNNQFLPINLVSNTNSQPVPIVDGAADMNYYAQYVATGTSTPGAVNTSVRFSLQYN